MTQPVIFTVITSQTNVVTGVANTGISNQQGGTVFGTVVGTAQVGQTVIDAAATLGKVETRFIPILGTTLAVGGAIDASLSLKDSFDKKEPYKQADWASLVSNVAVGVGSAVVAN